MSFNGLDVAFDLINNPSGYGWFVGSSSGQEHYANNAATGSITAPGARNINLKLIGDTVLTLTNGSGGGFPAESVDITIIQDSVGGHAFSFGSGVQNTANCPLVATGANAITSYHLGNFLLGQYYACQTPITPATPARGTATLTAGMSSTISTSAACSPGSSCVYKLGNCGINSSTALGILTPTSISAGTSFVISSVNPVTAATQTGDVSTVCWQIN